MLIDTSGWFCLLDDEDWRHDVALAVYSANKIRVTHSYVISELVGLAISKWRALPKVLDYVEDIFRDENITIVWVDEALTRQAMDLLQSRSDKSWSLCDAVSFVLMEDLQLTEALTTDHHFEQAGFIKLLES